MTTEVIILNAHGIAMAADSAVTITSGSDTKIYNSAIKIFSLSKVQPVGIMVYGNATLAGTPWETIIKEYRKKSSSNIFDKLEEYGADLILFIEKNNKFLFDVDTQKNWVKSHTYHMLVTIRDMLLEELKKESETKSDLTESEVFLCINNFCDNMTAFLNSKSDIQDISKGFKSSIAKEYNALFLDLIKETFQQVSDNLDVSKKLCEICVLNLVKQMFNDSNSGIVVAGYGEKEVFPSVISYDIDGLVKGKPRYRVITERSRKITNPEMAALIPFAQEDMISTFMKGISPTISNFFTEYIETIFEKIPSLLNDEHIEPSIKSLNDVKSEFELKSKELYTEMMDNISAIIQKEHISPVVNMIKVLPKDELATMAETLVSLTAFKRRMTTTPETVGGPIDVAVISKGDGLVWIRRKHYFPEELNQHFFKNYFRGVKD